MLKHSALALAAAIGAATSGQAQALASIADMLGNNGGNPLRSPNRRAPGAGMAARRKARKLRNRRR